jgi:ketosteroid isomerase-like protein
MRMSYVLCFLMAALSAPAGAGDLKQEVDKITSAYAEAFNKQNGPGIAALYVSGGMLVNATGPHTDIAEFYGGLFKAGFDHNEATVDQVSPLGADTAIGLGEYHITGKNQSGAPVEVVGRWTAVYVLEGGNWKVRMLSAFPKALPAPK